LRWRKSRQTPTNSFTASWAAHRWPWSVLLSILVGVILAAIGLDPWNIIESVRALIIHIWTMGFDILRWLWRYFLLGAVIVVPIWLLVRLAKAPRGS
jgi:hypothetical protein